MAEIVFYTKVAGTLFGDVRHTSRKVNFQQTRRAPKSSNSLRASVQRLSKSCFGAEIQAKFNQNWLIKFWLTRAEFAPKFDQHWPNSTQMGRLVHINP